MIRGMLAGIAVLLGIAQAQAAETALVTAVQGHVARVGSDARPTVKAFDRLSDGEHLALDGDARLRVIYFDNGRLEHWAGPLRLAVGAQGSAPEGGSAAEVRTITPAAARQIARMPDQGNPGRSAGRTRSISTPDTLARLEQTYESMRAGRSDADDLSAEMFLLSGLFELREFERVERLASELQQSRPKNPEAMLLAALYRKALRNARESGK